MFRGKEAESEAIVGGKPARRVSLQECPTGPINNITEGEAPHYGIERPSASSKGWREKKPFERFMRIYK
jgi:hypothetical protein